MDTAKPIKFKQAGLFDQFDQVIPNKSSVSEPKAVYTVSGKAKKYAEIVFCLPMERPFSEGELE